MLGLLVRAFAAALFAFTLAGAALAEDAAGDATKGKQVYMNLRCFTCHGRVGQGGGFNYPTPALAALELPVEAFQAFLRDMHAQYPQAAPASAAPSPTSERPS